MSKHHPALSWTEWGRTDAVGLAQLIRERQITAEEAASQATLAAALLEPQLGAVLEIFDDIVKNPAADGASQDGALWGVPLFVKDLGSSIAGRLRESGSALGKGRLCDRTDPLFNNLHRAGLVAVGRATTAEMGMTYDTTTSYRGLKVTRNPWNPEYTPGGSSGGSAALVAAGAVPLAHSTDGAGSTRIPAAFTGLVGLKVSRGRLPPPWSFSEYGNETMTEGVFSRTVRDTAAFLDAAAAARPLGKSFIPVPAPALSFGAEALRAPGRLRIGFSTGAWGRTTPCAPHVAERTREVAKHLQALGHHVEEVGDGQISDWNRFWPSFRTFWLGMRPAMWALEHGGKLPEELVEQLTPMARKFWAVSQKIDKAAVLQHQSSNNLHMVALGAFFEEYDLLLVPAFAASTPKANGPFSLMNDRDFDTYANELLDAGRYAIPASDAGIPSISLPAGKDELGLPLGIQLYGRWFEEHRLLQVATQLEQLLPQWFNTAPPVHVSHLPR
ncbi:amidase [Janthinobacterium sp. 17J80-10]|uniref:amidase n=1 Tax=Janthinobacterium sp. 17J80-10 TaxID=2497863 RepID=UPI0010053EC5|nr:amidase [Janthinobacterium sp. 17J80-10]QAU33937.1 amidase [Janthinobacterium sp. 17J80-10]